MSRMLICVLMFAAYFVFWYCFYISKIKYVYVKLFLTALWWTCSAHLASVLLTRDLMFLFETVQTDEPPHYLACKSLSKTNIIKSPRYVFVTKRKKKWRGGQNTRRALKLCGVNACLVVCNCIWIQKKSIGVNRTRWIWFDGEF